MQTDRSGASRKTPWKPRSQFARCESTTPLGRPVLPLVKKSTCGSDSRSSGVSTSASGPWFASSRTPGPRHAPGLICAVARVERREDGTELCQGDEERQHVEARVRPAHDAVAVADPQLAQRARNPVPRRVELAVGDDPFAQGCRDPVWDVLGIAAKDVADQQLHGARWG